MKILYLKKYLITENELEYQIKRQRTNSFYLYDLKAGFKKYALDKYLHTIHI